MHSIKETKEVLEFAEKALDQLIESRSDDGQINLAEWLASAVQTAPAGIRAVMGIDKVDDELKDLNPEETKVLAAMGVVLAQKVMALVMPSAAE